MIHRVRGRYEEEDVYLDAIFYEGKLCLVSEWLSEEGARVQRPGHIIVLEAEEYTKAPSYTNAGPSIQEEYRLKYELTSRLLSYRGPSQLVDGHMILQVDNLVLMPI